MEKIKAGIAVANNAELNMWVVGERSIDYTKYFEAKFLDIIQASLGHDDWGVWFKQIDEFIPKFYVDIYVNDSKDWLLIHNDIMANMDADPVLEILPRYWTYEYFKTELK